METQERKLLLTDKAYIRCPHCEGNITRAVIGLYYDIHENRFDIKCPYCKTCLSVYVELHPIFQIEEYI